MGFQLGRLVREAAGGIGSILAEAARDLRRRAHAEAGRVWRDVGELLLAEIATAIEGRRSATPDRTERNVAIGPHTRVVTETMGEVLALSGYDAVHADVDGRPAPELVRGTVRSHRPHLSAVGGGVPVLFDVYLPEESDPEEQLSRWQLFASAAAQLNGEFHVVVPAWIEGSPGKLWARRVADATGIALTKVWEI